MTIAVTTPTGHVGSRVVRLLLQAGARPRVLVRDPGRLDPAVRDAVEIRRGDLTDPTFVHEALQGARSVFVVDPTPHTAADPVGDSDRFGASVAAAVGAAGVARVVFLSSVGAERRHGVGHIDGLARIQEHLDATGADVCHLRCGYFFTNLLFDLDALAAGVLVTNADPDAPGPWVDPATSATWSRPACSPTPGAGGWCRPCTAPRTCRSPASRRSSRRCSAVR